MNRKEILAGEGRYLEARDEESRSLEDRLFGGEFAAAVLERGYLEPDELGDIAYWRWRNAAPQVRAGNDPDLVERFTRAAIAAHNDARLATWILTHLHGVHIGIASTVLAVLFRDEHTVMDGRAWSALKVPGWAPDLEQVFGDQVPEDYLDRCATYEAFQAACLARSAQHRVSLQALERFLYVVGLANPARSVEIANRAQALRNGGNDASAERYLLEEIAGAQARNDRQSECTAALWLSTTLFSIGRKSEGVQFARQALVASEGLPAERRIHCTLNLCGLLGQLDLESNQEAESLLVALHSTTTAPGIDSRQEDMRLQRLQGVYQVAGRAELAESVLEEILDLRTRGKGFCEATTEE